MSRGSYVNTIATHLCSLRANVTNQREHLVNLDDFFGTNGMLKKWQNR